MPRAIFIVYLNDEDEYVDEMEGGEAVGYLEVYDGPFIQQPNSNKISIPRRSASLPEGFILLEVVINGIINDVSARVIPTNLATFI